MQSDEAEVDMDELVRLLRQGPYDGLLHKILAAARQAAIGPVPPQAWRASSWRTAGS